MSLADISAQFDCLLEQYAFSVVKIGLIENLEVLHRLVLHLKKCLPGVRIVWDPILSASAGFNFHNQLNSDLLEKICSEIYLITPNLPEAIALGETEAAEMNALALSKHCHVFLKGGHHPERAGEDVLFVHNGKRVSFKGVSGAVFPKHGSGCILSSAITGLLAKGYDLEKACLLGKNYVTEVLESNESLLGYHAIRSFK